MEDYILYRLTGEFATDYSIAARTMAFDINSLNWSEEIMRVSGIPTELMPQAYPGGTVIGAVSKKAAASTGLPAGTAVATGGHDHACAAVAVKIMAPNVMLDSMGTAETGMILVENIHRARAFFDRRLLLSTHLKAAPYMALASIQACGGSMEWLLSAFKAKDGLSVEEQASSAPPGCEGLMYIPHINGNIALPNSKGAFIGIRNTYDFGYYARAVMEGLCYELNCRVEDFRSISTTPIKKVRAVGGVSRSGLWMQIKADVLGLEVEVPRLDEAAGLGAAILAGVGSGIFKDVMEGAGFFYKVGRCYTPSAESHEFYSKRFGAFKKAVSSLLDIYESYPC